MPIVEQFSSDCSDYDTVHLTAEMSVTKETIIASNVTDEAHSQGDTLSLSYATESEELLQDPVNAHTNDESVDSVPADIAKDKTEASVQPKVNFPCRRIGKSNQSFQLRLYSVFLWIEYSVTRDTAFCFPCFFFYCSQQSFYACRISRLEAYYRQIWDFNLP